MGCCCELIHVILVLFGKEVLLTSEIIFRALGYKISVTYNKNYSEFALT